MGAVFVVIPAFNEDLSTLTSVVHSLLALEYSIIIVDDGSEAGLKQAFSDLPVVVITHTLNLGQGAAIQTGFDYLKNRAFDFAVTFDADGQHHASDIANLLVPLVTKQADVSLGSRFIEGASHNASWNRRMMFKVARQVNRLLLNIPFSDTHNGLRAFSKFALEKIFLTENRMAHASEILSQIITQQLRAVEVPVQINYTKYSTKKGQRPLDSVKIFFDLFLYKIFK